MNCSFIKKISAGITSAFLVLVMSGDVFATGNYTFGPGTGVFYVGRQFDVNINMATNQGTTAADIEILYDACKLTVVDALPAAGTQIFTGSVFPTYPLIGNTTTVSTCAGNIQLTGFTSDPAGVLQGGGSGQFGRIRFKVRDADLAGSILDIRTDGFGPTFTLDSNISNVSGFDMLNAATDGVYELRIDQDPVPDLDDRPTFGGFNPATASSGILIGANILFNTFDDESGVDVTSISSIVTINAGAPTIYAYNSPGVTPSCSTSNLDAVPVCNLTINPSINFPYDADVCSTVSAQDLSQAPITFTPTPNSAVSVTSCFRTQYDLVAPTTINNIPAKNSANIPGTTPFTFNLIDNETGSNINTVIVTIKGIDYTLAGPNFLTFTGTSTNYAITVPTATLPVFVENEIVTVRIRAQDTATQLTLPVPNQLDETYTFRISDTLAPVVTSSNPVLNTTFTSFCSSPLVNVIEDTGSGVDINSVRIFVSATGLYYTALGPNVFTYTGSSTAYTVSVPAPVACWPNNVPIAVGVFARDTSGNYLDAYIYALGGSASSTVQTIINTVTNTVGGGTVGVAYPVIEYRDVIREVEKLTPPQIIEKIITLYKLQPSAVQKKEILKNVEVALIELANAGEKTAVVAINTYSNVQKRYWFFEGRNLDLKGTSTPLSALEIEVGESRAKLYVNVDAVGNWEATIPNTLRGYYTYTITARTADNNVGIGLRYTIAKVTIVPWWWIIVGILSLLTVLLGYKIYQKKKYIQGLQKKIKTILEKTIKDTPSNHHYE